MNQSGEKEEQILIRITGQDRPGLTASVMGILAKYGAQVLDIGQADIHATLSLGVLIRLDEMHSGQVMKELLFKTTELGVNIGFSPITDEEYENWVNHQGKNRYILTMIGRSLSAQQIEATTKIIAQQGLNIDRSISLSTPTSAAPLAPPPPSTNATLRRFFDFPDAGTTVPARVSMRMKKMRRMLFVMADVVCSCCDKDTKIMRSVVVFA